MQVVLPDKVNRILSVRNLTPVQFLDIERGIEYRLQCYLRNLIEKIIIIFKHSETKVTVERKIETQ